MAGRFNEKNRFHSLSEQLVKKYNYECVLASALIVLIKIYYFYRPQTKFGAR